MTFLLYLVIGLGCSLTVLGDLFKADCGHGINTVKIIHQSNTIGEDDTVGYVIYPRAILTVAHRVKDFHPKDLQITNTGVSLNNLIRNVSKIYIHPEYNACKGSYDFAVLTFQDTLPDNYVPICLPPESFEEYKNVMCDYSLRNDYYSRFYVNPRKLSNQCSLVVTNFNQEEDIINSKQCSLNQRGESNDIVGDRWTMVNICKIVADDNKSYREYFYSHIYYGKRCAKDRSDAYIIYDGEDLYKSIRPWILSITSILLEEDDKPLKLEIPLFRRR